MKATKSSSCRHLAAASRRSVIRTSASIAALASALAFAPAAVAQDGETGTAEGDTITITGSRVRRDNFEIASPVDIIGASELDEAGISNITDIIRLLPYNAGSQFQEDLANQNRSAGTAQFNLRNLGLNTTLTLLNGRRIQLAAVSSNDGSVFVDINQFPLAMIDRVEVLKDGGSALYGSDAVAGVVNLITRQVEGLEVEAGYQTTTDGDASTDTYFNIAFGADTGATRVNLFFTHFDRTPILENDVFNEFRIPAGFPGSFITSGGLVADPDCEALGGIDQSPAGGCSADIITDQFYLVAPQQRRQFMVTAEHDVSEALTVFAEANYSKNDTDLLNFNQPVGVGGTPVIVPASNPFNPFGEDAAFLGNSGPEPTRRLEANEYERYVLGGRYDITANWSAELSYMYGESRNESLLRVITAPALQAALNGITFNGELTFWNPFASAQLDPALANPEGLESTFVIENNFIRKEATLETFDGFVSGDLGFELPGGTVGAAFGAQHRREYYMVESEPAGDNVFAAIAGGDVPLQGGFEGERDVTAVYGEIVAPVLDNLELSAAVRFEDYGDGAGDTTDPKVAARYEPLNWLALRASWGTSFRGPSLLQTFTSGETSNTNLVNPYTGTPGQCDGTDTVNAFVSFDGNPDLKPESSDNINAGFTAEGRGLSVSADYWRFDYEDVIVNLDAQTILLEDCLDDGLPNGSRITYGSDVTDPINGVNTIQAGFINAGSVKADGVDLTGSYTLPLERDLGVELFGDISIINSFDIQVSASAPEIDGAGNRNRSNPFAALPDFRANGGARFSWGDHAGAFTVRHISAYDDDINGGEIDAFTTLDLQYSYTFGALSLSDGGRINIGVQNVTDEAPPRLADEPFGFQATLHDARGRIVYANITSMF